MLWIKISLCYVSIIFLDITLSFGSTEIGICKYHLPKIPSDNYSNAKIHTKAR